MGNRVDSQLTQRQGVCGRQGQTLVEYALILTLIIVIVILVALGTIGETIDAPLQNMADQISDDSAE